MARTPITPPKRSTAAAKPEPAAPVVVSTGGPFQQAPGQAKFRTPPDMRNGFQTVVNDLFADGYDPVHEHRAILSGLTITDALTPQRLQRAANEQETIADRAHRLFIVAKIEVKNYQRETDALVGAMRAAATAKLEQQKIDGLRTKQVTDTDVTNGVARWWPDEWSDICTRRDKAKAMLEQMENLSRLASSRCYTIGNMTNPGRKSRI